ncbi:MAG: 6-carboxyhexanoate--CoA ligase [Hydrogenobaculum sp.]|nr:MAG: 6-carboxyhexanoate--CoA ligase [Hydrogenobaculum sp.]
MRDLISIRMRASFKNAHISGAERICKKEKVSQIINELLKRPKFYDFISIKTEEVKELEFIKMPSIRSFDFKSVEEARAFAKVLLEKAGIKMDIANDVIELISKGAAFGKNMRGAMLIDIDTGQRLEEDKEKGIRTIKVDWEDRDLAKQMLLSSGYKITDRALDALALVSKNIRCGVIAEVCWSDDVDYTTGYVVVNKTYYRINPMKNFGDPFGGRAYFIKAENLENIVDCLRNKAFLVRLKE